MALTNEQIIENITSLGEQGAGADIVSQYIESEGLLPDDFIQRTDTLPTAPIGQGNGGGQTIPEEPVVEEETIFSKVANTINNAFDAITPGEDLSVNEQMEANKVKRLARQEKDNIRFGSALEVIGDQAKQSLVKTAKFIPWAITSGTGGTTIKAIQKLIPALRSGKPAMALKTIVGSLAPGISTGATVGGAKFVEDLASGDSIEESVQNASDAGVPAAIIGAALPLAFKAAGKSISALSEKLAPASKKTAAQINEIITSTPAKDFEFLLDKSLKGEKPLQGAFNAKEAYHDIGKKVQKAINYIDDQAGNEVGKEVAALRGVKEKIDTKEILKRFDDSVSNLKFGVETKIKDKDLKLIKKYRDKLSRGNTLKTDFSAQEARRMGIKSTGSKGMQAGELQSIKSQLDDEVKFTLETVDTPSSAGKGILKKLGGDIRDTMAGKIPTLAKVNAEFSKIRGIEERLRTQLKDKNVARNVKNLYNKDIHTQELFAELDELAPKALKFQDDLSIASARDAFSQILPGRGGGHGSPQGFANAFRVGSIATSAGTSGLLPAAALTAAVSPAIGGRAALAAASGVGKAVNIAPGILDIIGDPTVRFAATKAAEE